MQNSSEIHYLPIHAVKSYVRSARIHSPKQRRKLNALLRKFGQVAPIIVDSENVIVDGHAVYAGLVELGFDEIAAVVLRNRDPSEIRALRLALNRLPREAGWDRRALRAELRDLLELGFEMDLTGFDAVEIDMALAVGEPAPGTVKPDAAADLVALPESVIKAGDIYRLGRHLVACGDARDGALLRRLVGGRAVHVVFAAPPRIAPIDAFVSGVSKLRPPELEPTVASAEMTQDCTSFLADSMEALVPVLNNGAILFFCLDWRHMRDLLDAAGCHRLAVIDLCIWAKSCASVGAFYHSQHELVFVLEHGHANLQPRRRARTRSDLWPYPETNPLGDHGAELPGIRPNIKPVAMIADALKDVTKRSDLVLDPFLGSGSTLIAAEDTGRTCVGIVLDPGAVQGAIMRWETHAGQTAVHAHTGETLADRVQTRRGSAES